MRWLVSVAVAVTVLGILPGAGAQAPVRAGTLGAGDETALYLGEVSAEEQIDETGGGCGRHTHYSWSASKLQSGAFGGSGFGLVNGGFAEALGESGSGTVVLDPCGDTPGCSDTLTLITGPGDGVDFGLEGGSLVVNVGFTSWAESGGCGVPFQYPGTALTSGHIPLSAIGSPTITVDLSSTTATPDGEKVSRGSGTLTLHRVDTPVSAFERSLSPVTVTTETRFNAGTTPPGATVESYEFQMRRRGTSTWTTLGSGPVRTPFISYKADVAGHFQLRTILRGVRATPKSLPRTVYTGVYAFEVMFPTREQIGANRAVRSFADHAWREMLRRSNTPLARHEVGFWVRLETCHVRYVPPHLIIGPPAGPNDDNAKLPYGRRPPDDPKDPPGVKSCARYTLATFHTHTPTEFRRPLTSERKVGPSDTDKENAKGRALPGLVFDYVEHPPGSGRIQFGWPMEKPARIYYYGPSRRATPR